jgi:hypothetical protein
MLIPVQQPVQRHLTRAFTAFLCNRLEYAAKRLVSLSTSWRVEQVLSHPAYQPAAAKFSTLKAGRGVQSLTVFKGEPKVPV